MTTRKDAIIREFNLTADQYIMLENYVYEREAANIWLSSDGPNDEDFYIGMANENNHAATVLAETAKAIWNLDVREIYNELSKAERHDMCFNPTFECTEA